MEVTFLNTLGQSHSLLRCSAFRHLHWKCRFCSRFRDVYRGKKRKIGQCVDKSNSIRREVFLVVVF